MSELHFAGITFKGGKLLGIIVALSTLISGSYGVFIVYKDYMDMKEIMLNYTAPDLSSIQEQISVSEINIGSAMLQ